MYNSGRTIGWWRVGIVVIALAATLATAALAGTASNSTRAIKHPVYGTVVPTLQNPFWVRYVNFQKVAAKQLGFKLIVIDAQSDGAKMLAAVHDLITRHVDGFSFIPYYGIGPKVLKLAEQSKVPAVTNDVIVPGVNPQTPGHTMYRQFIGPGDVPAGYVEAKALIAAMKPSPDGKKKIIGLQGVLGLSVNTGRVNGLKKAVKEAGSKVQIVALPAADFLQDKALDATTNTFQGHPDVTGVWAANDAMAIGAIKALQRMGKHPGKDVIVAGLNGDDDAITAIKQGTLVISPAGHWLMGGFALAALFDDFNGHKIRGKLVSTTVGLVPVNKKNVAQYEKAFPGGQPNYKFRHFSKTYNPSAPTPGYQLRDLCPKC